MLSRNSKKEQIAKLSDSFAKAKASFLVNCIGLNAEQTTELRKSLKQIKGDIQVIRNTLSLRAMEKAPDVKKACGPHMEGPNAFVLAFEDPAKTAKIIDEFSEENEAFKIKAAVLDGSILSREEIKALASLPSAEVLKAQFLGLLQAPLSKFLAHLKEPSQAFARLLSAAEKGRKEASS